MIGDKNVISDRFQENYKIFSIILLSAVHVGVHLRKMNLDKNYRLGKTGFSFPNFK